MGALPRRRNEPSLSSALFQCHFRTRFHTVPGNIAGQAIQGFPQAWSTNWQSQWCLILHHSRRINMKLSLITDCQHGLRSRESLPTRRSTPNERAGCASR